MVSKRDTQFAGFAKALWSELEANIDFIPEGETRRATFLPMVEGVIARRAYDLVEHTFEQLPQLINLFPNAQSVEEILPYVRDLTQIVEE